MAPRRPVASSVSFFVCSGRFLSMMPYRLFFSNIKPRMENHTHIDNNPFCAARGCGWGGAVTRKFSPARSLFPFFTLGWGERNPLNRIDLQVMKHPHAGVKREARSPRQAKTPLSIARLQWFSSPELLLCPPPDPFCVLHPLRVPRRCFSTPSKGIH